MEGSNAAKNTVEEKFLNIGRILSHPPPGEEVVISGISGRFAECNNVLEFKRNLLNKIDMVSDKNRRWGSVDPNIPQRYGQVPTINKFDPGYFGIEKEMADAMDPSCRTQLEAAVEAIMDAGINPVDLEGCNVGVFVATGNSEAQPVLNRDDVVQRNSLLGILRSMNANRISYHLKLKGPSYSLDAACAASLYALAEAYHHIRLGKIDAAIVGGVSFIMRPQFTLGFKRLGILSDDGVCKAFDENANGYVRSEASSVIYLQKMKDCRRAYAKVVHVLHNCAGYSDQGITHPSKESQMELLTDFYIQCGISPSSVDIMESHGTGTKAGDPVEIHSIDKTFCQNRENPLILGALKTNMGHAENCSAHCQIIKGIFTMESGLIMPNLNLTKPLNVKALHSGKIKMPTEVTPYKPHSGRIAISSFGFGGTNTHCLLEWHKKSKIKNGMPDDDLPRLVCVSGRCEDGVKSVLNHLKDHKLDFEFVALLHKIYRHCSPLDIYRGFSINSKEGEIISSSSKCLAEQPQITILFGGNCFRNVAKDLLYLPMFQQIIQRMDKCSMGELVSDLLKRIDVSNSLLAATAIQIAVYEVFKALGLKCASQAVYPNGALADAYSKNKLSLQKAILLAHNMENVEWGVSQKNTKNVNGYNGNPPKYDCNSNDVNGNTYTINGEKDQLTKDLIGNLANMITHKNDLNVLQSCNMDNVLIGFGSNRLALDAEDGGISKPLALDVEEGIVSFLAVIGRLYELGHNPDVEKLYPQVQFPVSRGTAMISPLIKWDHRADWFVLSYSAEDQPRIFSLKYGVDTRESEWSYLKGHVIDGNGKYNGKNLFPAAGYLFLVWKTFSVLRKTYYGSMHVVFENVKFLRATALADELVEFVVSIQPYSGNFEVMENDSIVVKGIIREANDKDENVIVDNVEHASLSPTKMLEKDVYKELKLRGYDYSGLFKGLDEYYPEESLGYIKWIAPENWIVYMELMIEMCLLQSDTRKLYVPTHIQRLTIDSPNHLKFVSKHNKAPVRFCKQTRRIQSGHVCIDNLNASAIPRRNNIGAEPVLEKYIFVPNTNTALTVETSARINSQIVVENINTVKAKVVEYIDTKSDTIPLAPLILHALLDIPLIEPDVVIFSPVGVHIDNIKVENRNLSNLSNVCLVVGQNLMARNDVLNDALDCLTENGFIISREPTTFGQNVFNHRSLQLITVHSVTNETIVLLRKRKSHVNEQFIDMSGSSENFDWLCPLQRAVSNAENVTLYAENDQLNGIIGLINSVRKEPGAENIKCIFVQDSAAPPFNPNSEFYKSVLEKGLTFNIYKNGKWGTYRNLHLEDKFRIADEHSAVDVLVKGDLSSLSWVQARKTTDAGIGLSNELVHVYYSAVNFRDVMVATNRMQSTIVNNQVEEDFHGSEFSGKTESGNRVMGLSQSGSLTTLQAFDRNFMVPVPEDWTLEDAATVPVAYTTALYAFSLAKIRKGQSILIHAGTGSVGQAAINIALHYGLEVFTTVGTREKREYIKKYYPKIKECHIGNSRDTSFERLIRRRTRGKGVNIVLNSLSEEKLLASLQCLAYNGTFLEIGKYDLSQNSTLHLELLKKNVVFHGVCLDKFLKAEPLKKQDLMKMLLDGIENGCVKPLRRTCFGEFDIEDAYRYIAAGKHIGKVLIEVRKEDDITWNSPPSKKLVNSLPRYYCYPEYSYIVTGGLGGFGLELTDWLVTRGARKIVLSSRTGVQTGYQDYKIRKWRNDGCEVLISTANILTKEGCQRLLKDASALAPVVAIFNLSALLSDAMLENQTVESFIKCLRPKAKPVEFLDALSRDMCPNLKDFVVFSSSAASGRGNPGQINYGMANSIVERICEKRRDEGLPALAIQWGAIGDVGLVTYMQKDDKELTPGGMAQQRISNCLQVLDRFMSEGNTVVSSIVVAEKHSASATTDNLVEAVAHMLGIKNTKTVSMQTTLPELGMDSMVAVEIKQFLEREKQVCLTPSDIRSLTFARLHEMMAEK